MVSEHGIHVFGNLFRCSADLSDEKFIIDVVLDAVKISNSKLIKIASYKFDGGVSVVAIVAESHISIHTWSKEKFATVDVYTCGYRTKPEEAFKYIAKMLKPEIYTKKIEVR